MNIKETLLSEFDKTLETSDLKKIKENDFLMHLHEYSDLYVIKKIILNNTWFNQKVKL